MSSGESVPRTEGTEEGAEERVAGSAARRGVPGHARDFSANCNTSRTHCWVVPDEPLQTYRRQPYLRRARLALGQQRRHQQRARVPAQRQLELVQQRRAQRARLLAAAQRRGRLEHVAQVLHAHDACERGSLAVLHHYIDA